MQVLPGGQGGALREQHSESKKPRFRYEIEAFA